MADAETNAQKVAHGIMKIMAEARKRAPVVCDEVFKGPVNLMAGGITWVDEDQPSRVEDLIADLNYVRPVRPKANWVFPLPAPVLDSRNTRALANALDRTIAAGTWNGTSFGRK